MKAPLHPALALYRQLFDKAVADGAFCNPGWIVERAVFYQKCEEAGIEFPKGGFIEEMDWEESIGLNPFYIEIPTICFSAFIPELLADRSLGRLQLHPEMA